MNPIQGLTNFGDALPRVIWTQPLRQNSINISSWNVYR